MTDLDYFCKSILTLDDSIRFVGIASIDLEVRHFVYRKGIAPLLNDEETDRSLLDGAIRMELRRILEHRLGDCNFIYASYAKVKKITIPIREEVGSFPEGILELTLELKSDHERIVTEKILPIIDKNRLEIVAMLGLRQSATH